MSDFPLPKPTAGPKDRNAGRECTEVWNGNGPIHNAISVPGIDVWASSDPFHGAVRGGDVHYVSICEGGSLSRFAVMDVAGHGAAANELGRRLRSLLRKHVGILNQAELARAINRDLIRQMGDRFSGQFATALLTAYDAATDQLIICNAGHPRPIWFNATAGRWGLLDAGTKSKTLPMHNLPLGISDRTHYQQFAVPLDKGDLVLLYTDSLIEAIGPRGRRLGEHGLLDLVNTMDPRLPERLNDAILTAVAEFRGGAPAQDDERLLVLHHNAAYPFLEADDVIGPPTAESVGLTAA
ncbi:MAG: PP2C family protein-serine/threonine phosphatase [Phycisphaerales bacterium]